MQINVISNFELKPLGSVLLNGIIWSEIKNKDISAVYSCYFIQGALFTLLLPTHAVASSDLDTRAFFFFQLLRTHCGDLSAPVWEEKQQLPNSSRMLPYGDPARQQIM